MNEEKVLTNALVLELGLDKVDVITSDMLEGYTRIGYEAFRVCDNLKSITIPNSVTLIEDYAFFGCSSLKSINIPNSVTDICKCAFFICSSLINIKIPESIISISESTFNGCSSLRTIIIPNSVTSIEDSAFEDCYNLTEITIPDSVTSIGRFAFNGCYSLKSIIIPNSVVCFGTDVFYRCRNLNSMTIDDKTYETQEVVNGKCKAYKAFYADLTCRRFQYEEGKTYEYDGEPILCEQGFHACLRLTDVFNYYYGVIGKVIVVHEVELEGVSDKKNDDDSKVVAKKITIGKRIL